MIFFGSAESTCSTRRTDIIAGEMMERSTHAPDLAVGRVLAAAGDFDVEVALFIGPVERADKL